MAFPAVPPAQHPPMIRTESAKCVATWPRHGVENPAESISWRNLNDAVEVVRGVGARHDLDANMR